MSKEFYLNFGPRFLLQLISEFSAPMTFIWNRQWGIFINKKVLSLEAYLWLPGKNLAKTV